MDPSTCVLRWKFREVGAIADYRAWRKAGGAPGEMAIYLPQPDGLRYVAVDRIGHTYGYGRICDGMGIRKCRFTRDQVDSCR